MADVDILAIFNAVQSHAMASGHFEEVRTHEPDNAPPGISAALWIDEVRPIALRSGLDKTSALLMFNMRLYSNGMSEPKDEIDPDMLIASFEIIRRFTSDFTLDGLVANVDLLGAYSQGLRGVAGYVNSQEIVYRVITIDIPIVLNDAWEQLA